MRIKMRRHLAVIIALLPIILPIALLDGDINNENGTTKEGIIKNIDQIRPFRLAEKRVHEQPGIGGGWKREKRVRANDGGGNHDDQEANRGDKLSLDWQIPGSEESKLLEQIPTIDAHADFTLLANESLLHFRTPTYQLRYDQCLEVHFRVEGKRTRLLLYTCRMFEGGLCVLDKFLATTSVKKLDNAAKSELDLCHKMQPWMFLPSPFAFHFRFVRRPRKFADREIELRHFRRRFGRHATREVGRVKLAGFHPCNVACQRKNDDETELTGEIQLAEIQDRYMEDPLEGWGK